eukprot:26289-Eustigmatos_ZCMA.PRE.1
MRGPLIGLCLLWPCHISQPLKTRMGLSCSILWQYKSLHLADSMNDGSRHLYFFPSFRVSCLSLLCTPSAVHSATAVRPRNMQKSGFVATCGNTARRF